MTWQFWLALVVGGLLALIIAVSVIIAFLEYVLFPRRPMGH